MELNISEILGSPPSKMEDNYDSSPNIYPSKPILSASKPMQTPSAIAFGVQSLTTFHSASGSGSQQNVRKKKSVSYDDILSTLNMQVVNGKLQISKTISTDKKSNNFNPDDTSNYPTPTYASTNSNASMASSTNINYQQPYWQPQYDTQTPYMTPQKNWLLQQPHLQQQQEPEFIPMSRQEYLRRRRDAYLKQQLEIARIKNIKSTKLLFSTNVTTNANHDLNQLFRINGKR
jgi:hypothetical protein